MHNLFMDHIDVQREANKAAVAMAKSACVHGRKASETDMSNLTYQDFDSYEEYLDYVETEAELAEEDAETEVG